MLLPAPGGILALDLSQTTGWAYGGIHDRAPACGFWRLPHIGGEGGRYAALENELSAAIEAFEPGQIILEKPLSFQALLGVSTAKVMQQQYTLRGIAYMLAYRFSLPISEIDAHTVRAEVMGSARFAPNTVKREVVRYCRRAGFNP